MTDAEIRAKAIEIAERLLSRTNSVTKAVVSDATVLAHELANVADRVETYLMHGLDALKAKMTEVGRK